MPFFPFMNPSLPRPQIRVGSRRWFLQTSFLGLGGLSLTQLPAQQASAASPTADKKAVILFWLSGGPSHMDMWDPKPEAPQEIRGPYRPIATKIPGVQFSEHLPLQASIAGQTVDPTVGRLLGQQSYADHHASRQSAGAPHERRQRRRRVIPRWVRSRPSFAAPTSRGCRPSSGLADSWTSDVWESGDMGQEFAPVKGHELAGKFAMPPGVDSSPSERPRPTPPAVQPIRCRAWSTGIWIASTASRSKPTTWSLSGKVQQAFDVGRGIRRNPRTPTAKKASAKKLYSPAGWSKPA